MDLIRRVKSQAFIRPLQRLHNLPKQAKCQRHRRRGSRTPGERSVGARQRASSTHLGPSVVAVVSLRRRPARAARQATRLDGHGRNSAAGAAAQNENAALDV